MMSAFGLKLVLRDRGHTLAAVAGIAVAVLIGFIEMGFLNGVVDSHLRTVAAARGDIVVVDHRRANLHRWDDMLPIRLNQLAAMEGVASVVPVYQAGLSFRSAPDRPDHRIIAMAFPPHDPALELHWEPGALQALREPGVVLMDRLARPIYGPLEVGQDIWLGERRLRLGGFFSLGPTVINDGLMIMSEGTLMSLAPQGRPKSAVVRVSESADVSRVRLRIEERFGAELRAFTRDELAEREALYLKRVAPLGILFGAGMLAGLFVGLVICYQVLYVAVRRRLKAYATLKAMGFGNRFLLGAVLQQALFIGLLGYLAGTLTTLLAYDYLAQRTGLLIGLNPARAAAMAGACALVCLVAGAAAAQRAMRARPADLF